MLELKTVAIREDGCFGALLWDGRPFAVSLERTFAESRPIIQAGTHHCKRSYFNRGEYETFEIEIPGHTRVLFHKGNVETDSEACILVAESFARMGTLTSIADSKHGFEEFMSVTLGLDEFDLLVSGR